MNLQESIRKILKEEFTKDKNLYGEKLKVCSKKPMTGYYRDGYCRTGDDDTGSHTVCARVTEEFLEFTNSKGNNLDMLEPGDKWCLCAKRWEEANKEGVAPEMIKSSTNIKTFDIIDRSEDDEEKKIRKNLNALRTLISMFDYSEVCDMWVEYNSKDGDYEIKSKMSTKNHNTKALEKEFDFLESSIKSLGLKAYVFRPYYVEECEDKVKFMNESENKNQSLLSLIEEHGLYEFMKMTGLSLPQIYTKTGELLREVFERYIKDFIDEHGYHQTNGAVQMGYGVEISHNIYINYFHMERDKVTVEITGYDNGGKITDAYIESLSNLSDNEIFNIVDNMIGNLEDNWD